MRIAVIGATGLVGRKMLQVLEERDFPVAQLIPVASESSLGMDVLFRGTEHRVVTIHDALGAVPDITLFSAGAAVSREWAPRFAERGTVVVDNSSAWRMEEGIPLVVPEVNAYVLHRGTRLIANPNCATIQLVVALWPLHRQWQLRRLVISTYQAVSGTGKAALDQYRAERHGTEGNRVYPHQIFGNCLPQCDVFLENHYTKEEMKLVHETRKILDAPDLAVTATAVRVPVVTGHCESVNAEFSSEFEIEEVRALLGAAPGVRVIDDPANHEYPMPVEAEDKDSVYVGRIRRDESQPRTLNLWIVADNLRKGAATNAVQIAELMQSYVRRAPAISVRSS